MTLLRDLESDEFETATVGDYPVAATDRWLVLLDSGQPFCSLSPGSVLDAATPRPPIIVAPAKMDLHDALASPAFAQAADVGALVLVEEQRIVGVWGAPRLETNISRGVVPTRGGSQLPGVIGDIPLIVRSCTYREPREICATVDSFPSKPFPMPSCRNERHLSAHTFGW